MSGEDGTAPERDKVTGTTKFTGRRNELFAAYVHWNRAYQRHRYEVKWEGHGLLGVVHITRHMTPDDLDMIWLGVRQGFAEGKRIGRADKEREMKKRLDLD